MVVVDLVILGFRRGPTYTPPAHHVVLVQQNQQPSEGWDFLHSCGRKREAGNAEKALTAAVQDEISQSIALQVDLRTL